MVRLLSILFLALAAPFAGAAEYSEDAEEAALVAAVAGTATVVAERHDNIPRAIAEKSQLYVGDTVQTRTRSYVKLAVDDGTEITVGERSRMTLDAFLFEESNPESKLEVGLAEGLLRYAGGTIDDLAPDNIEVRAPNATIGIRGTAFRLQHREGVSLVHCEDGSISVTSEGGTIDLEPGESARVAGSAAPEGVVLGTDELAELDPTRLLAATPGWMLALYIALAVVFAAFALRRGKTAKHSLGRYIFWILAVASAALAINTQLGFLPWLSQMGL